LGLPTFTGKLQGWLGAARRELSERLSTGSTLRFPSAVALAEAQARARTAEHRLREALDVLPEGIVFLDAEGRYVLWNQRYAEMYERSADLFCEGAKLADTLRIGVERGDYPQAIGREEEWLAERLALLGNPGVRHEQKLANGRWIMIEERRTTDGGVIGLRVDITDMKAQSQALEDALRDAKAANLAKGEFLANMSHEIRTPLNGVIGLADVLSRTNLDERQRDMLRTLAGSAADLDNLLRDLLDFSRLEAGKLQVRQSEFDLALLLRDCAALFAPAADKKGVRLTTSIDPQAEGLVVGDPARLKQVITNLLSNAVKFTERGQIALAARREPGGQVKLAVRDSGHGFAPQDAERLFERFEQADGSITRRFGGVGLGLAISRELVELMGGTIRAEGQLGVGALFVVDLPLPAAAAAPAPGAESDPEPEKQDYPPLKVLACDDNPTNLKVVELMLAQVGVHVMPCENGLEALNAVRAAPFDLILMDLQMPVMDGLTATREIRADEKLAARRKTPLVVLSANVSPEDRAATAAAGADAHIGKPITAEELITTMMTVLEEAADGETRAA